MAVVGTGGEILLANQALENLLRFPIPGVEGSSITRFFCSSQAADFLLGLLATPREVCAQCETEWLTYDGQRLPILISVAPRAGAGGNQALLILENLAERQAMRRRLDYLTYFDPLTGLANRRMLENRLEQAILKAERDRYMIAVLLIDLHRFKKVSQSFDRQTGNFLLREAGDRMVGCLRKTDTLGRYQGDKFGAVIEGLAATEPILRIIGSLFRSLEQPFSFDEQEIFLNANAGIAIYPENGEDSESLLKNAETALYGAKEQNREFLFYTQDMNVRARERLQLESELLRAVERQEFEVFFQPQIDAVPGSVCGLEALLRWKHPRRGYISPLEFIPVLEETGRIIVVDRWVLAQACRQISAWQKELLPELQIAVNLSARQFQDPSFVTFLGDVLTDTGLHPGSLVLEITESLLMRDTEESASILASFARLGVRIAIDDFGTGFSSLAYLKQFPIQTVKIDRNFVQGIPHNRHDMAIGFAILSLAENLGLQVIAEGVEVKEQFDLLRSWNCRHMQGFLFARPMPAVAFPDWLARDLPRLRETFFSGC